jgi:peptide deformylase
MSLELNFNRNPLIRRVLLYPDPTLNKVSKPVLTDIVTDTELQNLMDDMVATMKAFQGVGLSAIQIGVPLKVLVVQGETEPLKIINPVIQELEGESWLTEGCLSIPGFYTRVKRPDEVLIEYFNEKGERKTTINDGLLGRAILHEMDHLLGLTIFDKLSRVERSVALEKYRKLRKKFKLNAA